MILRVIIGLVLFILIMPAPLFIAAGTANWPMAWVYIFIVLASVLVSRLIVWKTNPDTLRERAKFISSEGMKSWDRVIVVFISLVCPLATMLVAGLDHRFEWSNVVPEIIQYLAVLVLIAGSVMAVWAMVVNRFFSAVARIQEDRGQVVVDTGPYRIVRHPSYSGAMFASLCLPFMLNALWTLVPALVTVVVLIIRTALEDRMLLEELNGYGDYAKKTRFRLIPGVW